MDVMKFALGSFFLAAAITAVAAQWVIKGNRREEEKLWNGPLPPEGLSLHFIRQEISTVFTALMITNGLLAGILAALLIG
jgi:hypothetical protein